MISFCGFILFQSMIYETGPCPRPEILTEGQIKSTLEERNLSSNGTRSELNARLTQDNYGIWGLESCKVLSFWRFICGFCYVICNTYLFWLWTVYIWLQLAFSACSNATLPAIQNSTIASIIHYSIDSDCLRIETCSDIPLNISGNIYSKSLKVTFDVEPCSFLLKVEFEKSIVTRVLLSYNWGR